MRCATWLCVSVMRCVGILDCPICMGETMILACLRARYAHDSSGHLYHWCARCMRLHSSTSIPSLCVCLVGFRIWFLSQHTSNMPCEWQATSSGSEHARHHQTEKKTFSLFSTERKKCHSIEPECECANAAGPCTVCTIDPATARKWSLWRPIPSV